MKKLIIALCLMNLVGCVSIMHHKMALSQKDDQIKYDKLLIDANAVITTYREVLIRHGLMDKNGKITEDTIPVATPKVEPKKEHPVKK